MSKPGLFRALREFLGELRSFGNPELDNLKQQVRALQVQLDQLEGMRSARVKQEEALALMQAQSSVQSMQQLDRIKQRQQGMVAEAIEMASAQTDKQIRAVLEQKAQKIVTNLDLSKALSLEVSPEEVVANTMKEVNAQLQAEGLLTEETLQQQNSASDPRSLDRDKG